MFIVHYIIHCISVLYAYIIGILCISLTKPVTYLGVGCIRKKHLVDIQNIKYVNHDFIHYLKVNVLYGIFDKTLNLYHTYVGSVYRILYRSY